MSPRKPPTTLVPLDARIVRIVLRRPGIVRGELAAALAISPASAAVATKDLVHRGALMQSGQAPSQGGRPATRLRIAPRFAAAYAHSVIYAGLRSGLVDAGGTVLKAITQDIPRAQDAGCVVQHAEEDLAPYADGVNITGSTLILPGSPHPERKTVGKAPWLFGAREIDADRPVLTNAEALLRSECAFEPDLLNSLGLVLDMNDGASAVISTPPGSRVLLNLMGMRGPEEAYVRSAFVRLIREHAKRPDSSLGLRLEEGMDEVEALGLCESEGDIVACALVDETSDAVSKFVASLARMVRPVNLVVASWLFAAKVCQPDDIRRRVRRMCPHGVVSRLSFRCTEADEHSHLVGGALCAIDSWLAKLEHAKA
ncbi:MAG: hypothetical protein ACR2HJ_02455 [Fimbriimonadales bacterium]